MVSKVCCIHNRRWRFDRWVSQIYGHVEMAYHHIEGLIGGHLNLVSESPARIEWFEILVPCLGAIETTNSTTYMIFIIPTILCDCPRCWPAMLNRITKLQICHMGLYNLFSCSLYQSGKSNYVGTIQRAHTFSNLVNHRISFSYQKLDLLLPETKLWWHDTQIAATSR